MMKDQSNLRTVKKIDTNPEKVTKDIRVPKFEFSEPSGTPVEKPQLKLDSNDFHVNPSDFEEEKKPVESVPEETFDSTQLLEDDDENNQKSNAAQEDSADPFSEDIDNSQNDDFQGEEVDDDDEDY